MIFLLVLCKITRDLSEISLEKLYGVLKTYELEQAQMKQRYGWGKTVNTSTDVNTSAALVVESPVVTEQKVVVPRPGVCGS